MTLSYDDDDDDDNNKNNNNNSMVRPGFKSSTTESQVECSTTRLSSHLNSIDSREVVTPTLVTRARRGKLDEVNTMHCSVRIAVRTRSTDCTPRYRKMMLMSKSIGSRSVDNVAGKVMTVSNSWNF